MDRNQDHDKDDLLEDQRLTLPVTDDGDDDDVAFSVTDDDDSGPLDIESATRGQNEPKEYDAEDDDVEASGGGDDDLDDIRSDKIRDRIMRERRIRERDAAERLRAEEAYQNMLFQSERQKLAIQRDSFKMAIDSVDLRIRTIREALKAAELDGDRAMAIDMQAELEEARKARGDIEAMQRQLPSEDQLQRQFAEHRDQRRMEIAHQLRQSSPDDGGGEYGGIKANNQMADRWAKANKRWMNDPRFEPHRSYMMTVNNKIADEGISPEDPRFFQELTRRMAKAFPALDVRDMNGRALNGGRKAPAKPSGSPPVASARVTSRPEGGKQKNRVELTADDRRMMRLVGLDPMDKSVQQRFAREKLSRLRNEARR